MEGWTGMLAALGAQADMYEGKLRWTKPPESAEVAAEVEELCGEWSMLSVNLDEKAGLRYYLSPEVFGAAKAFQCEQIRQKRRDAYRKEADDLFFEAEADGTGREKWLAKRKEIQDRFPWPGEYR